MNHIALARKWRPQTFAQLVGQEPVSKAIAKSLDQDRLHHAYLFSGTRGVGKTSIGRLFAKALNCEQGISSTPCLVCSMCQSVEQGRCIDLIEIDAASKTKVEDTRELLENVQYAPSQGRFKVYLIDEVHMLSQSSFNALLKTLEEPPAHVKFLLATTDPQKIPATVLSRCLQFNLRHIDSPVIEKQLITILGQEQIDFEPEALTLIAKSADGSMRDALSLLDQAIAVSDTLITSTQIKNMLGYTQHYFATDILLALAEHQAETLIQISRQIAREGGYFLYVIDELLSCLHHISLTQALPESPSLYIEAQTVTTLAKRFTAEEVQLFYQIVLKSSEDIQLAPSLAVGFEMMLLRLLTFKPSATIKKEAVLSKNRPETASFNNEPTISAPDKTAFDSPPVIDIAVQSIEPSASLVPEPIEVVFENLDWQQILTRINLSGLPLNAAENAEFICKEGQQIQLKVASGHQSLFTPNIQQRIENALSEYYGEKIRIHLTFHEAVAGSPAQKKQTELNIQKQHATESVQQDPFLKSLQNEFSAELVKNSIEAHKDRL